MEILRESPFSQLSDKAATASAVSPTTARIVQGPKQELLAFSYPAPLTENRDLKLFECEQQTPCGAERKESKAVTTGSS